VGKSIGSSIPIHVVQTGNDTVGTDGHGVDIVVLVEIVPVKVGDGRAKREDIDPGLRRWVPPINPPNEEILTLTRTHWQPRQARLSPPPRRQRPVLGTRLSSPDHLHGRQHDRRAVIGECFIGANVFHRAKESYSPMKPKTSKGRKDLLLFAVCLRSEKPLLRAHPRYPQNFA